MPPIEWLIEITQHRDGFRRLLDESGGLAEAAYRLARAKCITQERSTEVPTRGEVRAAARLIADKTGRDDVPRASVLFADLRAQGLLVL
ncbi:MAG: hypothetical protein ACFCGT_04135 [Sandaracinaceae bacterium]